MSERAETPTGPRRFILVSHPRSGTHWLRSALESNPAIRCQAEIFNADNQALPWSRDTPVAEIIERVYGSLAAVGSVRALGFVVHTFQPGDMAAFPGKTVNPRWQDLWHRLAEIPGAAVIHLYRRNLVRRHLSHVIWSHTRIAHRWDPDRVDAVTQLGKRPAEWRGRPSGERPVVALDARSMELDFRDVEDRRAHMRRMLGHLPMLEVAYEDLLADFDDLGRRLQRFLGVPPVALQHAMYRMEDRPLVHAIANYRELAAHFRASPWAAHFDE